MANAKSEVTVRHKPKLSSRGQAALSNAGQFIGLSQVLFQDGYHPTDNPTGFVSLGVAENTLMHEELTSYFNSHLTLSDVDLTYGTDLGGSIRLNGILAKFLTKYFHTLKAVLPSQIVGGAGCSALIDQLSFHLAEEGEGILIPVPYYSGFNPDLKGRSRVKPIPVLVDSNNRFGPAIVDAFETALEKAKAAGTTVRAVILCNPQNPLGQCYPRETILAYARFCQRHDLHLISDEIYALSVFPTNDVPKPEPFVSVMAIDLDKEAGCDPSRVHVIYGMSKDFGSNGLRIGAVVSQYNDPLLKALRSTSLLMKISSASDVLWSALLNDGVFLPKYIAENNRRLREAYEYVTAWLKFQGVPYLPSNAGHFVLADFGKFLPTIDFGGSPLPTDDNGWAADQHLFEVLLRHKLYLGTSSAFSYPVAGWFRITFATRRDYLVVGLTRLEKALGMSHWTEFDAQIVSAPKPSVDATLKITASEVETMTDRLQETAL